MCLREGGKKGRNKTASLDTFETGKFDSCSQSWVSVCETGSHSVCEHHKTRVSEHERAGREGMWGEGEREAEEMRSTVLGKEAAFDMRSRRLSIDLSLRRSRAVTKKRQAQRRRALLSNNIQM